MIRCRAEAAQKRKKRSAFQPESAPKFFLPYSVLMASISASTSSCVVDQLVAKRATLCSSSTLPQVWKAIFCCRARTALFSMMRNCRFVGEWR